MGGGRRGGGGGGGGGGARFGSGMMGGGGSRSGGGGGRGGGSSSSGGAGSDHQSTTGHSIHMRGLPFAANEQDVHDVSRFYLLLKHFIHRDIVLMVHWCLVNICCALSIFCHNCYLQQFFFELRHLSIRISLDFFITIVWQGLAEIWQFELLL